MRDLKGSTVGICRVLEADGELADALPEGAREEAMRSCIARELRIPEGHWQGTPSGSPGDGIGLLVLSGLLIRRVGIDTRFGAELLGKGDLLRPWQGEDEQPALPRTTGWLVLEPTRVAVLDELFAQRAARYPVLSGRFVGRALRRSRELAVNTAIIHQTRVDVRLHMLFWHFATRWGRVRADGVILPLKLTHNVLGDLAAAQRPTVTSAISQLAKRDLIHPIEGGWLLHGQPPGELEEVAPVPAQLTVSKGSDQSSRHS